MRQFRVAILRGVLSCCAQDSFYAMRSGDGDLEAGGERLWSFTEPLEDPLKK